MLETKGSLIMKKMRFSPLLALTAVLTACDLFGGNGAKAPTFAKEGDEVTYTEFKKQLQEASNDSEIADESSLLTDRVVKASTSSSSSRVWKRGKTELEKDEEQSTGKGESSYDTNNHAAKATAETKTTRKSSDRESTASETVNSKQEVYYQIEKVKGYKYLIYANAKTNQYYTQTSISGSVTDDKAFDNLIRNNLNTLYYIFSNSMPYSDSEAKDYNFHVNSGKLFTFSLTSEEEDSKSSQYYTLKTKTKHKVQLDLTDKKQALRYSRETKIEYDYKKSIDNYKSDDVLTEETKSYAEYTITAKDVKVNPVDISDYTLMNSNY